MKVMSHKAAFKAELVLKPAEAGGRHHPISSGYRCNCWIGNVTDSGDRIYNDAAIDLVSQHVLEPGAHAIVTIRPAFPELWLKVRPGWRIEIGEGTKVVGEATVLR